MRHSTECSILSRLPVLEQNLAFCDRRRSKGSSHAGIAFLYAGVSQHVPEFFRLCRLCRDPGAAGEL
jgi:hypothetical protein